MLKNDKTMIVNGRRIDNAYNTSRLKNSMEPKISRCCCKVVSKEMSVPIRHAIAIAV
jgi:hypothetical protein